MRRRAFLKSILVIGGVSILNFKGMGELFAKNNPKVKKNDIRGMLFDVQRFGIHDGPGIRTVMFFKGCPLRCAWCFNPESQKRKPELQYLKEKCTNCMDCTKVCKVGALTTVGKKLYVDFAKCTSCKKCVNECPQQALKVFGYKSNVNDIVEIAKRDKDYYKKIGGVTLTGGEVMYQPEYALNLLKELKKEGINTCIETCGRADEKYYEAILPYVNLFLFDYKLTDNYDHVKWTGVSNKKILCNLDFLCKQGAQVILRCPIIPTVNDNPNHFKAIAKLGLKYIQIQHIEIEPYVSFGQEKYNQIGRKPYPFPFKSVDKAAATKWVKMVKEFGYEKVQLS